jgi:uncharacterized protein (TIGR02145 family)
MRNTHSTNHVNPLIRLILVQTIAITFTLSCSGGDPDANGGGNVVYGEPVTTPDGKEYKTVVIGTQTWMAENLNYNAPGSKCYGEGGQVVYYDEEGKNPTYTTLSNAEIQANCDKYGRLYDWATAKAACPSGWHIPSDAELTMLTDFVGGSSVAGTKLKATSGWNSYSGVPAGTDAYGFAALPGGYGHSDGSFIRVGSNGVWWSSTDDSASRAYGWYMEHNHATVGMEDGNKTDLLSVRCVKK